VEVVEFYPNWRVPKGRLSEIETRLLIGGETCCSVIVVAGNVDWFCFVALGLGDLARTLDQLAVDEERECLLCF